MVSLRPVRAGLIAAAVMAAGCSKSEVKQAGAAGSAQVPGPSFTVFALAEMRGQIGPCGCTSDPLGDLSRTARLIRQARDAGPVIVLDAGSLLYSKSPVPPHLVAQEELKADLLATTYRDELAVAAIGLGPADLAQGPDKVRLPRHIVNAPSDWKMPIEPPKVLEVGQTKLGVLGVVGEGAVPNFPVTDPIASARGTAAKLRERGAQLVVGLVQAPSKRELIQLVKDIGTLDIVIAGLGAVAPEPERVETEPTRVGDTWVVFPVNRGQVLARIDVTMRGVGPLSDAVGPAAATVKLATIDKQIAALDADLTRFAADKDADPKFVAQKKAERQQLAAERDRLAANPMVIPEKGSYFTLQQIRVNKTLACAPKVQDAITAFNQAAGKVNFDAVKDKPVPPAPKGTASYVGSEACADCHDAAAELWAKTRHAGAWETLETRGQQLDFDCVSCHVTGWDKPGGSNLAFNEPLRDVQCETCHGPGSIHVAKGGEEKPKAIQLRPAEDMCATQCHTKEHSDTFEWTAYMRDIVGPGHGEALRAKLGDGPTGHQLRSAALEKAGRMGDGCVR